jgi:hypothetical protein
VGSYLLAGELARKNDVGKSLKSQNAIKGCDHLSMNSSRFAVQFSILPLKLLHMEMGYCTPVFWMEQL